MTHDLNPTAATGANPLLTTPLKSLFLLGDEIIDNDHRALHALFQAVIDSDNVAFPTALRALLLHTEQHFEREQELMAKYRYPGLRDHKAGHNLVLREFHQCIERVDRGQLQFGRIFVSERLVPWFELHVPSMDFVFVLHIQKQLEAQRSR